MPNLPISHPFLQLFFDVGNLRIAYEVIELVRIAPQVEQLLPN